MDVGYDATGQVLTPLDQIIDGLQQDGTFKL
jgi:hypothetical protein